MTDAVRKLVEAFDRLLSAPGDEARRMVLVDVADSVLAAKVELAREEAVEHATEERRDRLRLAIERLQCDMMHEVQFDDSGKAKAIVDRADLWEVVFSHFVEHAIARRALEAVEKWADGVAGALAYDDTTYGRAERNSAMACSRVVKDQLSLLGARNFEVVEIPQGEDCDPCAFCYDSGAGCQNPKAPDVHEMGKDWTRPEWCRSRYGVEVKP